MATFGNPIVASPNLLPSTAEVFNASKSGGYGAGEYVYREGKLYKFTEAHTGAWTGTDVEEVKLADEVSDVAAELSSFEENVGENYARIDGYYDELTAGNAEQLIATVGVDDNAPYLFRTTGGSADVGDRKTMELVGGTVAWNQLVRDGNFDENYATYWSVCSGTGSVSNGVITVTGMSGRNGMKLRNNYWLSLIKGHKYLYSFDYTATVDLQFYIVLNNELSATNTKTNYAKVAIYSHESGGFKNCDIFPKNSETVDGGLTLANVVCFDLTQMFGSTIADYIYALEQANAGAGVAWFRNLFQKPYYAYDAGTLMSVKTSANITTGFNAVHDVTYSSATSKYGNVAVGSGKLLKGHKYCISVDTQNTGAILYFALYDLTVEHTVKQITCNGTRQSVTYTPADDIILNNSAILNRLSDTSTTATGLCDNLCINLSWDGERDGEYEPYVSHEYALDPDLELRGIPKLDADSALYYDGDTYTSDGTVTRKFKLLNLGAQTWGVTNEHCFYTYVIADARPPVNNNSKPNILCPKYTTGTTSQAYGGTLGNCISIGVDGVVGAGRVIIYDSNYSDATIFAGAMSGIYLLYELKTSTTEEADPFTSPETVDDFGTEQYVDIRDVPIPVGHNSVYQANLRAKLEMAPNSPEGDGDYIVRQVSGINTYVPITFPADELPAAPTTDGTYVLKVTVADGTATYSWVSET